MLGRWTGPSTWFMTSMCFFAWNYSGLLQGGLGGKLMKSQNHRKTLLWYVKVLGKVNTIYYKLNRTWMSMLQLSWYCYTKSGDIDILTFINEVSNALSIIFLGTVAEDGLQSIGCCEIIKCKQLHRGLSACVRVSDCRAWDAASVVCVRLCVCICVNWRVLMATWKI